MAQNKARRLQAKVGLPLDIISKIDNIVDGIDAEFLSNAAIYDYLQCRILEKKHANNPTVEMKTRLYNRLHYLKQLDREAGIRMVNTDDTNVLPDTSNIIIPVAPVSSTFGGMISGLLGGSGSI